MPQLNKKKARRVEEAEGSGIQIIPSGVYTCKLTDVQVKPGSEADVWWAYFTVSEGGDHDGAQLLAFLSLSDKAEWKMREFFDAFGVPADTHTDKLIGDSIRLSVTEETAQQGKRKGQQVNSVQAFLPPEDDDEDDDDEEPF